MKKEQTKNNIDTAADKSRTPKGHSSRFIEVVFNRAENTHKLSYVGKITKEEELIFIVALGNAIVKQTGTSVAEVMAEYSGSTASYKASAVLVDKDPFVKASFFDADTVEEDCDGGVQLETSCSLYELILAYATVEEEIEKRNGVSVSTMLIGTKLPGLSASGK